ncbi:MAG TPA: hypothetical protein VGR80_09275 [Steroidobacteraceae bacterium]|nr:hypothetical protein [Steroidobacteraceae bacterium]
MNEIQLLREQLATERRHVRAVASACAAAHRGAAARAATATLTALREASAAHLALVLGSFEARDARLAALGVELPPGGALGREALGKVRPGADVAAAWGACAGLLNGAWDERRAAIDSLCAANPRVTDWRTFALVDADSIQQERAFYGRVRAALPAGLTLE